MFNIKWSALGGGFGLIVSLLVGIISGAGFPLVLIRAAVFGAAFFLLAGGLWLLINNFIPELLEPEPGKGNVEGLPGSRVDISVGDGRESALPELYRDSGEDELGDIEALISGSPGSANNPGMDQNGEDGYTKNSGPEFQTEGRAGSTGTPAGDLPDLDAMTGAFFSGGGEAAAPERERPAPERSPAGNKTQNLQGDFHPKELAAAIRTKISRD